MNAQIDQVLVYCSCIFFPAVLFTSFITPSPIPFFSGPCGCHSNSDSHVIIGLTLLLMLCATPGLYYFRILLFSLLSVSPVLQHYLPFLVLDCREAPSLNLSSDAVDTLTRTFLIVLINRRSFRLFHGT